MSWITLLKPDDVYKNLADSTTPSSTVPPSLCATAAALHSSLVVHEFRISRAQILCTPSLMGQRGKSASAISEILMRNRLYTTLLSVIFLWDACNLFLLLARKFKEYIKFYKVFDLIYFDAYLEQEIKSHCAPYTVLSLHFYLRSKARRLRFALHLHPLEHDE